MEVKYKWNYEIENLECKNRGKVTFWNLGDYVSIQNKCAQWNLLRRNELYTIFTSCITIHN